MDKSSLQAIGQDQPALQLFQACCYLESTGAQQSAAAGWHSHRTHTHLFLLVSAFIGDQWSQVAPVMAPLLRLVFQSRRLQ